jgi:hypothetical protein
LPSLFGVSSKIHDLCIDSGGNGQSVFSHSDFRKKIDKIKIKKSSKKNDMQYSKNVEKGTFSRIFA